MNTKPDFSSIPAVDRVLADPAVQSLAEQCDPALVTDLVRAAIGDLRGNIAAGTVDASPGVFAEVVRDVVERANAEKAPKLRRVINATGVVLHTNLGRAPLALEAAAAVSEAAGAYTNLELDLESGERGSRTKIVESLICRLTGAEAAAVVNNNAAAVLIALNTLALGREAVVSRGQLVEIGGSFRIPDIMARSGATMVEVGTTNRTHLKDYEQAVTDATGMLLVVHPSNFEVQGFVTRVPLGEVVDLARSRNVAVLHDLGSGALVDLSPWGLGKEPLVSASVEAGVDVTTFSGDKVLGGPQAGILVGKRGPIEAIRGNPLMRALRCDKMTYAALEATLKLFLDTRSLPERHPVMRMLTEPASTVQRRAERLGSEIGDVAGSVRVVPSIGRVGSGALPLEEIESAAVEIRLDGISTGETARSLRMGTPSVMGYVRDDRIFLDTRTIHDDDLQAVAAAVRALAGRKA